MKLQLTLIWGTIEFRFSGCISGYESNRLFAIECNRCTSSTIHSLYIDGISIVMYCLYSKRVRWPDIEFLVRTLKGGSNCDIIIEVVSHAKRNVVSSTSRSLSD